MTLLTCPSDADGHRKLALPRCPHAFCACSATDLELSRQREAETHESIVSYDRPLDGNRSMPRLYLQLAANPELSR